MGRPSNYTPELGALICDQIAAGASLVTICSSEEMPPRRTVVGWIERIEDFQRNYARAKDEAAEGYAEDVVHISDTEPDPQRARVRIDARKWMAGKLKPKKYGERMELEHSGSAAFFVEGPAVAASPTAWIDQYSGNAFGDQVPDLNPPS